MRGEKWDPLAVRALSADSTVVEWPPRLDARIHFNTGWQHSSWGGDVRAVVDNAVAVVLKVSPETGREHYALLHRWEFDTQVPFRYGPLPRVLSEKTTK